MAEVNAQAAPARPHLERLVAAAREAGVSASDWEVHATEDDACQAAAAAVALVREGACRALMKGSLHSDELLGAAVPRDRGLRGARRASHVFMIDVPGQPKPFLFTDCVVNIAPDLLAKRDIPQNAIE